MTDRFVRLLLAILVLALVSSVAYAQTSSVSGVVVDTAGGVVPGATVVVKNVATGATYETVSSAAGAFSVPALPIGTYTVTVGLEGFKTVVLSDVVANAGVPASVSVTLEVGALTETVTVQAMSEIVQTQSSAVSTTINVTQIVNLPLTSRASLDFVRFLPGVNTPGGTRDSTINGLPQSAINITLDGVNVQDNTLKTGDGFFAIVNPRLDAIEEVTMSAAAQGADGSGQGAVQIRFVTRSGTNQYLGSVYHYYRKDELNTNTWFNKRDNIDKAALLQNQWGGRLGGPLSVPGLFDGRDRAFFFFNYEEFRQPSDLTRNRTILYPSAETGVFRYSTAAGVQQVNLLALAAANGQLATLDPTVAKLLADIRASTGKTGSITDLTDPLFQRYTFNVAQRAHNRYPTVRFDVNVGARHRASLAINYQRFLSTPDTLNNRDPFFPGFPATATQTSERLALSSSLRSTLGSTLVNEFRYGLSGAPVQFSKELSPSMWGGTSVANQDGYHLNIGQTLGITNAASGPTPSSRNASTWVLEDTVSWLKGAHSLSFGGTFTQIDIWLKNQTLVPTINFGIVTGDPADAMFNTTNFPGASTTNLTNARALYALLAGRVSSITGNARLDEGTGKYVYMGAATQRGRMNEIGTYLQDSWRLRPDLTLNLGLRYELQLPFQALNDSYSYATMEDAWGVSGLKAGCDASKVTPETCNIFKPGTLAGTTPTFKQLEKGVNAYNVDFNNIAPSVGFSWTPSASAGFLQKFLGQPGDSVIRAGFARAYTRNGMSDFTDRFGSNPGILITANRDQSLGNLGTLPVLFRDKSTVGAAAFPPEPVYPMRDVVTGDVNAFDPNLKTPRVDSWSAGIQRAISQNMAIEIRYVGTRSREVWTNYDYNEINIVENGFLNEFRLAQQNLQANIAAGRGANFRYYGAGTGTSPLPITLAYFSGVPSSQAGDASKYTSSLFTNSTFLTPLAIYNPNPCCGTGTANPSFAFSLYNDATRRANALAAGVPPNFFLANPDLLGGAIVRGNGDYTNYNSIQMELRRRLSQGLQFQVSYAYGKAYESQFYSFRKPRKEQLDSGGEGGVTHAFKANWVWELPFGRGRRFGGNVNGAIDRLIGGWQIHGTTFVQTGRLIDFGNVRMVGFDAKELQKMYQLRKTPDVTGKLRVYVLPQSVIDETVKAFSVSATSPTGYSALGTPSGKYFAPANGPDCIEVAPGFGDCGVRTLVVTGPMFKNVDVSVAKMIPIVGRTRLEFRVEMLNVFDWVNFVPVSGLTTAAGSNPLGSNSNNFEVTTLNPAHGQTSIGRIVQLVSRVSW